ncbi:MAG: hypothetical protein ACM31C_29470 [Acidobacteriota bacterium]
MFCTSAVVLVACVGQLPAPPQLAVTSPERGLVQGDAGRITVKGTALPGPSGAPVTAVTVDGAPATLAADGSFTADVDVSTGAMLLETVAISDDGGKAIDARAVEVGQLRPVGTEIERAVTATLSAQAFARLSAAAGPILETTDFTALLAPLQPMVSLGDDLANVKLSITKLAIGHAQISLTPVDGGLQFSAELDGLAFAAQADYAGALVVDGSTAVSANADQVTIAGTLLVTPAGTAGFTTKLGSPAVRTTNLQLHASGLTGQVLDLVTNNLGSTVQSIVTSSAESALQPLLDDALGALAGPQQLDVLGLKLDLVASPSALTFTPAGALVTMNLQAKIEGSESSPGYIFTPNGTPALDVTSGIQLALADDLLNELLAEVHARGLLDVHLRGDFGPFDTADFKLALPPMISANTGDGSLRLVLGDMIATLGNHGTPAVSAAVNASVELAILRGNDPQQIALQLGKAELFVNLLDPRGGDAGGADLSGAANAGLAVQLDSLSQFLITVPLPAVAGVSLDSLSLRGDSGYVVAGAQIH